jgi:hypothetical protein
MATYFLEVHRLEGKFDGLELHHIRKSENNAVDALTKMGSLREPISPGIFLQHMREPSVKTIPITDETELAPECSAVAASWSIDVLAIIPAWTLPFLDFHL